MRSVRFLRELASATSASWIGKLSPAYFRDRLLPRVIGEAEAKLAPGLAEELVGVKEQVGAEEVIFAKPAPARVNKGALGEWRSSASAPEWVQEVAGSNPVSPGNRHRLLPFSICRRSCRCSVIGDL